MSFEKWPESDLKRMDNPESPTIYFPGKHIRACYAEISRLQAKLNETGSEKPSKFLAEYIVSPGMKTPPRGEALTWLKDFAFYLDQRFKSPSPKPESKLVEALESVLEQLKRPDDSYTHIYTKDVQEYIAEALSHYRSEKS